MINNPNNRVVFWIVEEYLSEKTFFYNATDATKIPLREKPVKIKKEKPKPKKKGRPKKGERREVKKPIF